MVLDEGQVLDGKYVIVRALGVGSMGEVYLGRNERIGKEVAVKVLRRDFAEDRAIVNRFDQEARIASAVKSSHVVDVYDLGELPTGERFIVMEYVDGESLGTRMTREGKLSSRVLGAITLQILDGLIAAHAAGVIHRDLKPDNVILTKRDGQESVKLVDFGISKLSEPGARDLKRATLEGMFLGTPMYMSPEQARGEPEGIDHRTDLFSLGVSMYEALSGEVPFNADNVVALLSKVMTEPEIPLEKHVPNVDPGLARIVKKAMAKDPSARYATAAEMREAVASWYAVFASTAAMRSSLEGIARDPSEPPPADPFLLPFKVFGRSIEIDRKRARSAAAAAAIAVVFTTMITRQSSPPAAPPAIAAVARVAPDPLVVPTTPVILAPVAVAHEAPGAIAPASLPPSPPAATHPAPKAVVPAAVTVTKAHVASRAKPTTQKHDEMAPAGVRDTGTVLAKADDAPSPSMEPTDTPPPDPPSVP